MNSKFETYRERMEAQIKEWKTKFGVLEEKATKATGETRAELLKAMGELRQKNEVFKEKWAALQKESGIAWESMKVGVEKAASDLKEAVDKVLAQFK
jgi:peptidoglycan hydrolase CwlO-like protein